MSEEHRPGAGRPSTAATGSEEHRPGAGRPSTAATGSEEHRPGAGRPSTAATGSELSHTDDAGRARMVDVGGKPVTERRARARAVVRMSAATAAAVERADTPKGDVIGTARIAGIQ